MRCWVGCLFPRVLSNPHCRRLWDRCERKKHPSDQNDNLNNAPHRPNLKVGVGVVSGSAIAKKTPTCAHRVWVTSSTLRFGGAGGSCGGHDTECGWVFFSLAPGSDFSFALVFITHRRYFTMCRELLASMRLGFYSYHLLVCGGTCGSTYFN